MTQQTKQTEKLAARIRKARKGKRGKTQTWALVSQLLNILKSDGSPDPGLAYRIAMNGYEPSSREVRTRIGLKDICPGCKRPFRKHAQGCKEKTAARLWWDKLNPQERAGWLEVIYKLKDGRE